MAGDALRLAQQQRLGGAEVDVAPPTRSRQSAIDTLLALATDILKEGGHAPSPDMRQRLLGSLDALAAYGTGSLAPKAGRLTEDVPAPGFAALAGLAVPAPDEDAAAAGAPERQRRPAGAGEAERGGPPVEGEGAGRGEPGRGGAGRRAGRGRPRRRGPGQGRRRLAGGPGSPARGAEGGRRRHHRRAGGPGRSRGAPPRHAPAPASASATPRSGWIRPAAASTRPEDASAQAWERCRRERATLSSDTVKLKGPRRGLSPSIGTGELYPGDHDRARIPRLHSHDRHGGRQDVASCGARRDALSAGAERVPAHRPRQVDLPELRRRPRVRRQLQPALRRHQSGQGRRRVRRLDQGRRAVARLRLDRPALRLRLFRGALRLRPAPDPRPAWPTSTA